MYEGRLDRPTMSIYISNMGDPGRTVNIKRQEKILMYSNLRNRIRKKKITYSTRVWIVCHFCERGGKSWLGI